MLYSQRNLHNINTSGTYVYHNNVLAIPARLLYDEWNVISYSQYERWSKPGIQKIIKVRSAGGLGNEALVSFWDLPDDLKAICCERLGDPKKVVSVNLLAPFVLPDNSISDFFARHRTPDGNALSVKRQNQLACSCFILEAIRKVLKDSGLTHKLFGKKKGRVWSNIMDAVSKLDESRWPHVLHYKKAASLQARYNDYVKNGANALVHKGEGNKAASKIKGEIADYILSLYCLPNKFTIPMVLEEYNRERSLRNDWPVLTRESVYKWLYQPEQERVWTLSRDGKHVYARKYQYKVDRDKSSWFPNVYWAIDGSKVDWVHTKENSSNGMGADLRVDVIFDVYSEKIIGWSISESETHLDHFVAVKQAVQNAGCRPYLFTYDNQSGHKMQRMQELYNGLVAKNKGTHYPHRSRHHGSPAEQLFNRIQQQVINRFWFSDGQSPTVKTDQNKANWDFISQNKHLLKNKDQLRTAFEAAVNIWNTAAHPEYKISRNEVYAHDMPMREDLTITDILQYMWLNETKPITYRRDGLTLTVADKEHRYEVYAPDGSIDIEFRRLNVGKKFTVRYDPDNMDIFIQLMEPDASGNLTFVANAEPKRAHESIPALMESGNKAMWWQDYQTVDLEYERDLKAVQEVFKRSGVSPERLIENQEMLIKMKGHNTKPLSVKADALEDDIINLM